MNSFNLKGSGQDGGIGRNPLLPRTAKRRITTSLKSIKVLLSFLLEKESYFKEISCIRRINLVLASGHSYYLGNTG